MGRGEGSIVQLEESRTYVRPRSESRYERTKLLAQDVDTK